MSEKFNDKVYHILTKLLKLYFFLPFGDLKNKKEIQKKFTLNLIIYLFAWIFLIILSLIFYYIGDKYLYIFTIITIGYIMLYYIISNAVSAKTKELELVKQEIEGLKSSKTLIEKLRIDVLKIEVSESLIILADPMQDGALKAEITACRYKLLDNYGYVTHKVRICDNEWLKDFEYEILVRENCVAKGTAYPNKILINAKNVKEDILQIEKIKFDGDFLEDSQNWYWINKTDAEKFENVQKLEPEEVIVKHFEKVVMDNVEYVFALNDTREIIELYEKNNDDFPIDDINIIHYIFVNLLKEKISIKDADFILDKIIMYYFSSGNQQTVLNKIKNDIKNLKDKSIE